MWIVRYNPDTNRIDMASETTQWQMDRKFAHWLVCRLQYAIDAYDWQNCRWIATPATWTSTKHLAEKGATETFCGRPILEHYHTNPSLYAEPVMEEQNPYHCQCKTCRRIAERRLAAEAKEKPAA